MKHNEIGWITVDQRYIYASGYKPGLRRLTPSRIVLSVQFTEPTNTVKVIRLSPTLIQSCESLSSQKEDSHGSGTSRSILISSQKEDSHGSGTSHSILISSQKEDSHGSGTSHSILISVVVQIRWNRSRSSDSGSSIQVLPNAPPGHSRGSSIEAKDSNVKRQTLSLIDSKYVA